ncbi:FeoB-associated Cys-rich membrane protein [uncultured Clostridium sp.]|jgi:hypothetical protein|uniref:FeoB-associated Cys-rich membrane protein n=1 Tax=uncultured Clostridium sp. TaxID=59620 RepID=UPI0028EEFE63|nr:FeoB-associated Cys-rich membrane protein [uncultured Clostridium sp.]
MLEVTITIAIVFLAGCIIVKSLKNSSKGKCNCGCKSCKAKESCSEKSNILIKK